MMKISYEEDRNLIRALLQSYGYSFDDADCISKVISHSDFTGVYSHGLSRLIAYIKQLEDGAVNTSAKIETLYDEKAVIRYDCHNGSGIVAVNYAYNDLLKKARTYGIGIATGMHSGNIGCGAYYGCQAVKDNMIGIFCCNTLPAMAPFGGADKLIGTNPIIVGVPAKDNYPIVLDISTSGVALGKIEAAKREKKQIPLGWAINVDGRPTTNPEEVFALLPIATYKGYGLAVIVDILSAVLSNAAYGYHTGTIEPYTKENTGFCIILIDPSKFMPLDEFKKRVDDYILMIKQSRLSPDSKEIFLPGEIEYKTMEETKVTGLEVSEALERDLCFYAAKAGMISEDGTLKDLLGVCSSI